MGYPYKRASAAETTVKSARFIAGAAELSSLPDVGLPEIAVIGRSNVGKSTLINRLSQSEKLARTSATPGRTQQLNIFQLSVINPTDKRAYELHLIDLPGFGYAKFSKELRENLSGMTVEYISAREQLRVVCLLADCRRDPGEDELAVRDLAFNSGRNLLVIVTKMDQLKRNDRQKRLAAVANSFSLAAEDVVPAGEDISAASIWQRIFPLLS